jgi:hypothetical protein
VDTLQCIFPNHAMSKVLFYPSLCSCFADLLSHRKTRLEKLFYRRFQDTRVTPKREFFRPHDSLGRDMVPLYTAVLDTIAFSDAAAVRQWYTKHRSASAMQRWLEAQHLHHSSSDHHTAMTPRTPVPTSAESSSGKLRGGPLVTVFGLAVPASIPSPAHNPAGQVRTFLDSPIKAPTPTAVPVSSTGTPLPPPLPAAATSAGANGVAGNSGGKGRGMQHMELEVQDFND